MLNGYGAYNWFDGRKYYGSWKNNDMHGFGIYIYADGVRFDGEYVDDIKQGYGIYIWTDDRKYEGWWNDGKQHGIGIYTDTKKQQSKYGLWVNGKRLKWLDAETVASIKKGSHEFEGYQP